MFMRVGLLICILTSQACPARKHHNKADDRAMCSECGWKGYRDIVEAISISRRTGLMVTVKEPRESELLDP